MAINKEKQISASVILDRETYELFKQLCKEEKRSASSQIAFLVDKYIKEKTGSI